MNIVQQMWEFCKLASKEPKTNSDPLVKDSIFTPMTGEMSYGFIADFGDRVIICFRETRGNIRSWFEDLYFSPTKETDLGTLHGGFHDTWQQFEQTVLEYVKKNVPFNKPIFCTGYSQGAAIATLCAAHIAHPHILNRPCSMINFGSPKVGKSDFRDIYNSLPINSTCCINGWDIVPDVPLYDMGFRAVGNWIHFIQPLWHKFFCKFTDHAGYDFVVRTWKTINK